MVFAGLELHLGVSGLATLRRKGLKKVCLFGYYNLLKFCPSFMKDSVYFSACVSVSMSKYELYNKNKLTDFKIK